ncbi:MAG: RsmB/NOP family class I SAM-dependent RNA methyltransferase [Alphaproteobacteria bacterium]
MQTSAKYKAVLEILTEVITSQKPADNIINQYLKPKKYIGSSDRRFITEETWHIIRNFFKLSFEANSNEARNILITHLKDQPELFNAEDKYGLGELTPEDKEVLANLNQNPYPDYVEAEMPEWLYAKINDMSLAKALNTKAPADFRINIKSREIVLDKLQAEGLEFYKSPISPIGVRSDSRVVLGNCVSYQEGIIEVQDQSSQIACILMDIKPNQKTIDYCAGAGGKALTLSYLLDNKGELQVHDINKDRLENIKPRLQRLNAKNIWTIPQVNDFDFDVFIVDAPCSGTGTLRRSPDMKLRLTPSYIKHLNGIQTEILNTAKNKIKTGGKIVYMTCSILEDENQNIINKFLKENDNFKLVNIKKIWQTKFETPYPSDNEEMLQMSPLSTDSDGFFISILQKIQ